MCYIVVYVRTGGQAEETIINFPENLKKNQNPSCLVFEKLNKNYHFDDIISFHDTFMLHQILVLGMYGP